jgi:hypothetical protein
MKAISMHSISYTFTQTDKSMLLLIQKEGVLLG